MPVNSPLEPWDINTPIDEAGNLASPELARWFNEIIVRAMGGDGGNIAEEAKDDVLEVAETAEQLDTAVQQAEAAAAQAEAQAVVAQSSAGQANTAAADAAAQAVAAQQTAAQAAADAAALEDRINAYDGNGPIPQ